MYGASDKIHSVQRDTHEKEADERMRITTRPSAFFSSVVVVLRIVYFIVSMNKLSLIATMIQKFMVTHILFVLLCSHICTQ